VLSLLLRPIAAAGQALQGTLVDDASRTPLQAVLVDVLRADDDSVLRTTASDARGRFSFARLPAGQYQVRVNRIGFRPWISGEFPLGPGQTLDSVWRVASEAVVLTEIVVESEPACRSSLDDDRRMALVWDEARKSLALLQRRGGGDSLEFIFTRTRIQVDTDGNRRVLGRFSGGGRGLWPITSQAPESLAQLGYVQPRDTLSGPIYYGPDPEVFFSDPFLQTHCFRLVPPPGEHPDWIGLGFRPLPERELPDIDGVLWLARQDATLRRLEFRYTRLWSWVPAGRAGGSLEFARLPGGQPVVVGWTMRAPIASREPATAGRRRSDARTEAYFGSGWTTLQGFLVEESLVEQVLGDGSRVLWTPASDGGSSPPR
jgi:hypothetical protein